VACASLVLGGCSNGLSEIDAKVDRAIEARSLALGSPVRPVVSQTPVDELDKAAAYDTDPRSLNPPASQLRYIPADENREVAKVLSGYNASGEPRVITLTDAFAIAQDTAREYITAEEEYLLSAIRLLIERHLWSPRLFNDTTMQLDGQWVDGRVSTAARLINEFGITQRLPYGGSVSARWLISATEQLRSQIDGRYRQSSEIVLEGNVPLLRGAGMVARENLIQAERDLVYDARTFERFRRAFLVGIASDYFALTNTNARIKNQERQIESLRRNETRTREFVKAGRLSAFQSNIISNDVLRGLNNLEGLREQYRLQLDRFKVRLGLPVDENIDVADIELALPDPGSTIEQTTLAALDYRLDLQNRRDQLEDARRGVANAKNQLLPDLNLNGIVTLPTDRDIRDAGVLYSFDDVDYLLGVTFGLPLDREIERLQLRQSIINDQRANRNYIQFRDNVVVDARAALRSVELSRFQLDIAQQQVEINRSRLREQELKADELDPRTLTDAENDLLQSQNDRDQALTNLRDAILRFLLDTGQLRVNRDGQFMKLPGMEFQEVTPPDNDREDTLPPDALEQFEQQNPIDTPTAETLEPGDPELEPDPGN